MYSCFLWLGVLFVCVHDDYEQDSLKSECMGVFLWCISTCASTHCQPYKQCSPVSLLSWIDRVHSIPQLHTFSFHSQQHGTYRVQRPAVSIRHHLVQRYPCWQQKFQWRTAAAEDWTSKTEGALVKSAHSKQTKFMCLHPAGSLKVWGNLAYHTCLPWCLSARCLMGRL